MKVLPHWSAGQISGKIYRARTWKYREPAVGSLLDALAGLSLWSVPPRYTLLAFVIENAASEAQGRGSHLLGSEARLVRATGRRRDGRPDVVTGPRLGSS